MQSYVVMVAGPENTGLRTSLESWLRGRGARLDTNIRALRDQDRGLECVRIEFGSLTKLDELQADLEGRASSWSLQAWHVQSLQRPKILVLASLVDHCLHELLAQHQAGLLDGDVVAVASNHQRLQRLVEAYDVPYVHIDWPADPNGAKAAHTKLEELIKQSEADLVVMARFMQIVPDEICRQATVLNIHHDDTRRHPGANPYARVRANGNRTIAATAHYATKVLDAGQIVSQESKNIDALGPIPTARELSIEGRQVEVATMMTAVRRHIRGEVFVLDDRTMFFPA